MAQRLSIGARWAVRYTASVTVTLGLFAWLVHGEVARRINREAALVTEVEARSLVDSLRTQTAEHSTETVQAWLEARIAREVERADPALGLSVQYLDPTGQPLISAGTLERASLPVPRDVLRGEVARRTRAVNLGGPHAHLVTIEAAPGGFIRVATSGTRYAENVDHIRDVMLGAIPFVLLGTALLGHWLARGSLEPIARITRTARRITGSNLREKIPLSDSGDELDELASTLNEMIGRIGDNVEKSHRFNANAAHELSTPLHAIRNQLGVILDRDRDPAEYRQTLEDVSVQIDHLSGAVEAMLRLSRSEAGVDPARVRRVDVRELLEDVSEFFAPVAADRRISLTLEVGQHAPVHGDPAWLQQAVSNVIDNAIKYGRAGDQVRISADRAGEELIIHVEDTGPGIPEDELRTIFDRFQRGNRDRSLRGFGLGLALVREIVAAHGGRVEVQSQLGRGTRFSLHLPTA